MFKNIAKAKTSSPDREEGEGIAGSRHVDGRPDFTFNEEGDDIDGDQLEEEYAFQHGVFGYDDDEFEDIAPEEEKEEHVRRTKEFRLHRSPANWENQIVTLERFGFRNRYHSPFACPQQLANVTHPIILVDCFVVCANQCRVNVTLE